MLLHFTATIFKHETEKAFGSSMIGGNAFDQKVGLELDGLECAPRQCRVGL